MGKQIGFFLVYIGFKGTPVDQSIGDAFSCDTETCSVGRNVHGIFHGASPLKIDCKGADKGIACTGIVNGLERDSRDIFFKRHGL